MLMGLVSAASDAVIVCDRKLCARNQIGPEVEMGRMSGVACDQGGLVARSVDVKLCIFKFPMQSILQA